MIDETLIAKFLAKDVYFFDMVVDPLVTYANQLYTESGSGHYKLSIPLQKKFEKQFIVFKKKNLIKFPLEATAELVISDVDATTTSSLVADGLVSESCIMLVLEDHTHTFVEFYPTITNITNAVGSPVIDLPLGEGQVCLLNNKVPHLIKHKQSGRICTLVLRLSHGFNMIREYV